MTSAEFASDQQEKNNHMWKEVTEISQVDSVPINWDFEEMLISAERYACGRKSGVVQSTCWYIATLLPKLSNRTLAIMCNDFEQKRKESNAVGHSLWGMEQDEDLWYGLWNIIIAEQEHRKKEETKDGEG